MLKWTHAQSSLSEADIQELVDAHNLFRSMVEPQASNIQRVVSFLKHTYNMLHYWTFVAAGDVHA